jgi:hypothetical protein
VVLSIIAVGGHTPKCPVEKEKEGQPMARINVEPLATFADGSQLLVSTRNAGAGRFTCELYMAKPDIYEKLDVRAVSNPFEGPTCLQAQESAYAYAKRLYPSTADGMKKPPYLVWSGPSQTM